MLKIDKVNFEVADFGKLFTHLKFVGLNQVMSQIEAKTKKEFTRGVWYKKIVCLPATDKFEAGHVAPN